MGSDEQARIVLRQAGFKATPPRLAIYAIFKKASKPISIQNIVDELPNESDAVTVYRTVSLFKNLGLVKHVDFQHRHAHYELTELGDHHHIICTQCHRIEDVHDCNLESLQQKTLRRSSFTEITNHSLEFFGICNQCKS